jgi:hypothetical protein
MQEVYSKLTEDEQRILKLYHQKINHQSANNSDQKLKIPEDSENTSNQNISYRSDAPLKVLQTKIFNDSQTITQPIIQPKEPKVIISKKPRSSSTPKRKKTPTKGKTVLNSSKCSVKTKNSSRNNSSSKIKKTGRNSSGGSVLDITKIPNWKYEVNKLVRTVFRHSILCTGLREEAARIGGLRVLEEYRRFNNNYNV